MAKRNTYSFKKREKDLKRKKKAKESWIGVKGSRTKLLTLTSSSSPIE